jgi:hypothetical protein
VFEGVTESDVIQFLLEVNEGKSSLQELSAQCADVKILSKIQQSFVNATNCNSWEEAKERSPNFTTAENHLSGLNLRAAHSQSSLWLSVNLHCIMFLRMVSVLRLMTV